MKKLDVLGEVALMYMPASDELRDYLRLFRLEPASEVKFLELADRELKTLICSGMLYLRKGKFSSAAERYQRGCRVLYGVASVCRSAKADVDGCTAGTCSCVCSAA